MKKNLIEKNETDKGNLQGYFLTLTGFGTLSGFLISGRENAKHLRGA